MSKNLIWFGATPFHLCFHFFFLLLNVYGAIRCTSLMPVGYVTIATIRLCNHLVLVSSNRVARLKLQYKVKMLIFQQQTPKNQKQVLECVKVLQSGRQGTAPSHGGPQTQDTTSRTAGEEGESIYHFEIQLLLIVRWKSLAEQNSGGKQDTPLR